jgi:hypothetical protein
MNTKTRIEWTLQPERNRWVGRLKGHADLTLFILNLSESDSDECHLLGGVMADSEDRAHTTIPVERAKTVAEVYLTQFEQKLKAV